MTSINFLKFNFFVITIIFSFASNAALLSRLDGQAVYDTELNITWLTNANLAASNTFGISGVTTSGAMRWDTANQWIDAVNSDAGYLGFNDWRMPITRPVNGSVFNIPANGRIYDGSADEGFNVSASDSAYAGATSSEMAHLFYNTLGNEASFDLTGNARQTRPVFNPGPFSLFRTHPYWSATHGESANDAWQFDFQTGLQAEHYNGNQYFVMVVRAGDVATVPLPAAIWLFFSGLISLGMLLRRNNK